MVLENYFTSEYEMYSVTIERVKTIMKIKMLEFHILCTIFKKENFQKVKTFNHNDI